MLLRDPFFISAHLAPALKIGDATLSLTHVKREDDGRLRCTFVLEAPGLSYTDNQMRTGVGARLKWVELFENFIGFMTACAESYPDGENATLFPAHVAQWISDNVSEIECLHCDITDENGRTRNELITEN